MGLGEIDGKRKLNLSPLPTRLVVTQLNLKGMKYIEILFFPPSSKGNNDYGWHSRQYENLKHE